jgi:hypothetical protein
MIGLSVRFIVFEMCYRLGGIHYFGCIYRSVVCRHEVDSFLSFFNVVNPYVGVCKEFGDDANFPAGTVELCPLCGCSVRVVLLVLLFLCLISKGC